MKSSIFLLLPLLLVVVNVKAQVQVWQKWTRNFVSEKSYNNPYLDISIEIVFTGPENLKFKTFCYWTGQQNYAASFSFPKPGNWNWQLSCSDTDNKSLQGKSGVVTVKNYRGTNPLYLNGFIKVSNNKRYLAYDNDKPFFWMGCTGWYASIAATPEEWEEYINDRAKKHFTVIQIATFRDKWTRKGPPSIENMDTIKIANSNFAGESPFIEYFHKINPVYWEQLAEKVQHANEKGLVVTMVGLPGWQYYFTDTVEQKLFVQYFTGLFAGNFVVFAPSSDKRYSVESDEIAMAIDRADSRHLITQHPGTPSGKPVSTIAEAYYHKPYLDFSMLQTGHNNGNSSRCVWNAIHWNWSLYNREPHKPVINGEAFYHGSPNTVDLRYKGTDSDARRLGWYSWLSGSMGYTYGAMGIFSWGLTVDSVLVPWRDAIQLNSSFQMQYLSDFFRKISWWELSPYADAILNQAEEILRQMVFAKNEKRTLGVAYLPSKSAVTLDMNVFKSPVKTRWFNPRNNKYSVIPGTIENNGPHTFEPPTGKEQDWVLLLQCR